MIFLCFCKLSVIDIYCQFINIFTAITVTMEIERKGLERAAGRTWINLTVEKEKRLTSGEE